MAYLNKQQYDYRQRAAQERNAHNAGKAMLQGMTEEQADALQELCSFRHDWHCNMESIAKNEETSSRYFSDLEELNDKLGELGLPTIKHKAWEDYDNMDLIIYQLPEDYNMPDRDEDEKAWLEWYDDQMSRIMDDLSAINDAMEAVLREIDEKYNTNFAPTWALRIY